MHSNIYIYIYIEREREREREREIIEREIIEREHVSNTANSLNLCCITCLILKVVLTDLYEL